MLAVVERRGIEVGEVDEDRVGSPERHAIMRELAPASATVALGVAVELLTSTWEGSDGRRRFLELFEIDETPFREAAEYAFDRAAKAAKKKAKKAKDAAQEEAS